MPPAMLNIGATWPQTTGSRGQNITILRHYLRRKVPYLSTTYVTKTTRLLSKVIALHGR